MSIRHVKAGNVKIGGGANVTVQSMCTTKTTDVEATVNQILALEGAGCDIIRVCIKTSACARALSSIKARIHIPIVADIHFDYRLAIASIENGADKIRFNPGNIGGEGNVFALVDCAKSHGVPLRIGVNGGSLDKGLLARFGGATPEAMVESALKHVSILERAGFYDTVISIKASNVRDTFDANMLLSKKLDYPLHIGVTEAGTASNGTVKCAMGIGALLMQGVGDTIRVSLTGDPVREVYLGREILKAAGLIKSGIEIVSCPTCGRCSVDLEGIIADVEKRLPRTDKYVKVAIMGCAVNGPGEARAADIGIAFGVDNGVIFKKGERAYAGTRPEMIDRLVLDIMEIISEHNA